MKNTPTTEELEHCVICGALTGVPVSMPIEWRENYVIGSGQLCIECVRKLRKAIENANDNSREQIFSATIQSKNEQ